jgi:hypothetical protein
MNIFATGRDSSVYHKWWDGATWGPNGTAGPYESLGGAALGPPKAVSWAPNRIDVFVLGQDSSLYHKSWDGATWTPSSGFEFLWSGGGCLPNFRCFGCLRPWYNISLCLDAVN